MEVEQLNKRIDFLEKLILQNNGSSSIDKSYNEDDLGQNKEVIET
jgi:hypothetical protein